jgi:hypothetical protein
MRSWIHSAASRLFGYPLARSGKRVTSSVSMAKAFSPSNLSSAGSKLGWISGAALQAEQK